MKDSFENRIESYLDDSLSEDEKLAFAAQLDADPAAREAFVRHLEECHNLAVVASGERQTAPSPRSHTYRKFGILTFIAGAVAILLGSFFFFPRKPASEDEITYQPSTVGRVTTGSLEMSGRPAPLVTGQLVPPGIVTTSRQLATIQFDNGSSVALFPGMRANLLGIAELQLLRGRISGTTGDGANELKVQAGDITVTDLGTGFGVAISEDGDAEVHVLEGTVRLQGRNLRKRLLTEGNALRVLDGRQEESISLQTDAFASEFREPELGLVGYVHYGFEQEADGMHHDTGAGITSGPFVARPVNTDFPLHRVQARFGKGVTFGEDRILQSSFPGIGGDQPRTIAVWVKVDESSHTMSLVGWGKRTRRWEILLKARLDGALVTRTEVGNGYVLGTRNLADGKWHHFVSVYLGGNEGTVEQRIRHYVDGDLDPIQHYKPNSVDIDTRADGNSPLVIGRYRLDKSRHPFSGIMDEIYVFDRALSPSEIRELYQYNQPPEGLKKSLE